MNEVQTLRRNLSTMCLPHPEQVNGAAVCEVGVRVAVWTCVPLAELPPVPPLTAPADPFIIGECSSMDMAIVSVIGCNFSQKIQLNLQLKFNSIKLTNGRWTVSHVTKCKWKVPRSERKRTECEKVLRRCGRASWRAADKVLTAADQETRAIIGWLLMRKRWAGPDTHTHTHTHSGRERYRTANYFSGGNKFEKKEPEIVEAKS